MNITIVGAGNMGLAMAGYMTAHSKGELTVFTHKNIFKNGELIVEEFENSESYSIKNIKCTDDPIKAFSEADFIFITYPAFLRENFVENYGIFFRDNCCLCFVPGYGGIEYSCESLLGKGVILVGFQRVPYVARVENTVHGLVAKILSKKKNLYIAALPKDDTYRICQIITDLLDIPTIPLKEYLSVTLAPSNPLLHVTGLYNVFKSHTKYDIFEAPLYFYDEWNDNASEILFAYDNELQNICKALYPIDMSEVISLPVYYEAPTPEKMTLKLKSIESFKTVLIPLKEEQDGFHIDLSSRMFVEDFPYGVCIIKDFAIMTGVSTPTVDMLLDFYAKLTGHKYYNEDNSYTDEIYNTGVPGIHDIKNIKDITNFYNR